MRPPLRISHLALVVLISAAPLSAQDRDEVQGAGPASSPAQGLELTPDEQRELDRMLRLTLLQQKARAKELIKDQPDTRLAVVLRRLLDEYAEFERVGAAERAARESRTAWGREFWRARDCPLPPWNPPIGRITNTTNEPVLYELRLGGIYQTVWMGPYRLPPGKSYECPSPYFVRYLTSFGMREHVVSPGESYEFRGIPGTMLQLTPAAFIDERGTQQSTPPVASSGTAPPQPAPELAAPQ